MNYSVGVQRELGAATSSRRPTSATAATHLLRQPDINRASFDALRANAALPAAQRVSDELPASLHGLLGRSACA